MKHCSFCSIFLFKMIEFFLNKIVCLNNTTQQTFVTETLLVKKVILKNVFQQKYTKKTNSRTQHVTPSHSLQTTQTSTFLVKSVNLTLTINCKAIQSTLSVHGGFRSNIFFCHMFSFYSFSLMMYVNVYYLPLKKINT